MIRTITGALRAIERVTSLDDLVALSARLSSIAWNDGGEIRNAIEAKRSTFYAPRKRSASDGTLPPHMRAVLARAGAEDGQRAAGGDLDRDCRATGCDCPYCAAFARALLDAPETRGRRASGSIEGRWYITDRAAREYAHLMRPRTLDVDAATDELITLSERAHFVRAQENGLDLWRVKADNGARIRLLIGKPDGVRGQAKPALTSVLGEHGGVRR